MSYNVPEAHHVGKAKIRATFEESRFSRNHNNNNKDETSHSQRYALSHLKVNRWPVNHDQQNDQGARGVAAGHISYMRPKTHFPARTKLCRRSYSKKDDVLRPKDLIDKSNKIGNRIGSKDNQREGKSSCFLSAIPRNSSMLMSGVSRIGKSHL